MIYVAVPIALLALGRTIPVDLFAPDGRLLLRKGQTIGSEQQKEMLAAHLACMREGDAKAWQKSYERMIRSMLAAGVALERIMQAGLPSEIVEADYLVGIEMLGGWLDLQEILRGLLYQGAAAISPLQRLQGIENKAHELLAQDPDEALFVLFQALADTALGYCATHALLCAVVCTLAAEKLDIAAPQRDTLFRAALVMNIGMAREQDELAQQKSPLDEGQRRLIQAHPENSLQILQQIGVIDEAELDLVRCHHAENEGAGAAGQLLSQPLLRLVDRFVARLAPRRSRQAMSAMGAARLVFVSADDQTARIGSAIATVLGFYPPGSYVQLANGEQAVTIARGRQANTPQVLSIISAQGMPLSKYLYRDTSQPQFAVRGPLNAERVKVKLSLEKVRKARPKS
jgi:hypothetical protein